ncbi:Dextranase [Frankliniella fusca]|uniref:Dextranase n=1 Tax=Frankliniella fusca TaxID=407009 RepID=A0AAE1GWN1_9NEOP|nr:Dextranase [Frankliniella fusca]
MGLRRYSHNSHPKPKARPSKRSRAGKANSQKRWEEKKTAEASTQTQDPAPPQTAPAPTPTSASAKKIARFLKVSSNNEKLAFNYLIIHRDTLVKLTQSVLCDICNLQKIVVRYEESHGFCKKILLVCENCYETNSEVYSSPRVSAMDSSRPPFEINRVLVEAFLSIGSGYAAMERFCMEVGLEIMAPKSWENHLQGLLSKSADFKKEVLDRSRQAVREAHMEEDPTIQNDDVLDICISIDGSWQMRGHASSNGLVAAVDVLTGLVLDFEIMSKYCHMCQMQSSNLGEDSPEFSDWQNNHIDTGECQKNFEGSSGSMEMTGAERLFKRSIEECNMRYVTMLSDGDAKTFQHLQSLNVYPGIQLEKEECVNHVAKRMGTGLREKVKQCKAQKITLGGRGEGALTDNKIDKLTSYYRKAIINNIPNVKAMQNAVFATLEHCSSTDQKPKHSKCPKGEDSWCFYNKAKATKEHPKSHTEM